MDLHNLPEKDKQLYQIATERKNDFIKDLNEKVVPDDFLDILNIMCRAEYRRGKCDGIIENEKELINSQPKYVPAIDKFEKFNKNVDGWGEILKGIYADKIFNLSVNGDVLILESLNDRMALFHKWMINFCYIEAGHE